jgi:hypothetical protein
MMMSLVWAIVPLVVACERVVAVKVPDGPTRLVVEARLERVQGAGASVQVVRLTTTDPYFSNRAAPPAVGAVVRVVDEAGTVVTFGETIGEPGVFRSPALLPVTGRKYTLRIDWQGDRYESTESVAAVAPLDSLWFAKRLSQIGPTDGLRATIAFRDPDGTKNFYVWDQLIDGRRIVSPDTGVYYRAIASDDLLEGRRVRAAQPYGGIVVKPGQEVTMRQIGISEGIYRYFQAISEQAQNQGSPFASPAASVAGNVANLTRPSVRALGYFLAGEVSEVRRRVP